MSASVGGAAQAEHHQHPDLHLASDINPELLIKPLSETQEVLRWTKAALRSTAVLGSIQTVMADPSLTYEDLVADPGLCFAAENPDLWMTCHDIAARIADAQLDHDLAVAYNDLVEAENRLAMKEEEGVKKDETIAAYKAVLAALQSAGSAEDL